MALVSLPAYAILEALGGWYFWEFFVIPKTHFVVGWIDGALFGLFHALGLIAQRLLWPSVSSTTHEDPGPASIVIEVGESVLPTEAAADRSKEVGRWAQGVLALGMILSVISLGSGIRSYLGSQPKELTFQPRDREALLTFRDLTRFFSNGVPQHADESFSKRFIPGKGHSLTYGYTAPDQKVMVFSTLHVALSTDEAQTAFWNMKPELNPLIPTKLRALFKFWDEDKTLVQWGDEGTAYLIKEGSSIRGGAFLGYRENKAVLLYFVSLDSLGDPREIGAILASVLKRIETYTP